MSSVHYTHRLSYSAQERLVGAFVLAAVVLVIVLFSYSREAANLFADKFVIYGLISNAQGINNDSKVIVSGVEAGRVVAIEVASAQDVLVKMELLERFHPLLRTGATATLDKPPMLGEPRIVIPAGDPARPTLPAESILRIEVPQGMNEMLSDIGPALQDVRQILSRLNSWTAVVSAEDLRSMIEQLQRTVAHAAQVSEQLANGEGVAGQMLAGPDAEGRLPPLARTLSSSLDDAHARLSELAPIIANAQSASDSLPALTAELQAMLARMQTVLTTVELQVEQLPELVLKTRLLMDEADATMNAVQSTWPISLSVEETQGQPLIEARPLP